VIAVVISREDEASVTIWSQLYDLLDWEQKTPDIFHCSCRPLMAYLIDDTHLYHDHVDCELACRGFAPDAIVYASRHASKSRRKTLSVHPVGNYRTADFGGHEGTLVPAAPHLMAQALRCMAEDAHDLPYTVCYEVTHHGPLLETPTLFIEVGSTINEWKDKKACRKVAAAIARMDIHAEYKVAVGIGGGHYAPRFTDITLKEGVAFGHIIPHYQLGDMDRAMISQVIATTPKVEYVYSHGTKAESFLPWFAEEGLVIH